MRSTSLVLAFAASALLAHAADDPILGALRVESIEKFATAAGAFANRVQAGSGAAVAQLTDGAEVFGLDTAGEILVLITNPQNSAQPFAFVLPVTDPAEFKDNPAFGFEPTDKADRYRLSLGNRPMFGAFVGRRLVVSPLQTDLELLLPLIASGEDIRGLRAAGGQIALDLDAGRLHAAYKPMIDLMLMGLRMQFANATTEAGAQTVNPADMFGLLLGSLGELEQVTLSVSIEPEHLKLRSGLSARAGTPTAALLNPGRGPAVTTLGLHDPASVALGTLSAKPGPEFIAAYNDLSARFLAIAGSTDTATTGKTLGEKFDEFVAVWDGGASFAMLGGEALTGSTVVGVTDHDKALALLRSLPEFQKEIAALNEAQGLRTEVKFGEEENYHDAVLVSVTQTMSALNDTMKEGLAAMSKMGLDNLVTTYGLSGDRAFYTMGGNSLADAKRLVDLKQPPAAAIGPGSFGLPEGTTLFTAISLPRYMAWIRHMASLPIPALAVGADQKPGFAFTADLASGRGDFRFHLAASEIAMLVGAFSGANEPDAPADTVME